MNEGRFVDFKSEPSDDAFEIGKDVAALANAEGGTILIGAKGSGEFLAEYVPLASTVASAAQRTYEDAIRARCRPVPLFSLDALPEGQGVVLALNVWPFPGQPVGVALKKGEAKCGKQSKEIEGLYWFPRRVGAHTMSISPEQLPMFMDARIRRMAVVLANVRGQMVTICFTPDPRDRSLQVFAARLEEVDVMGNAFIVSLESGGGRQAVSMPLDAIVAAWKAEPQWRITMRGNLEQLNLSRSGRNPPGGWYFLPGT